MKKRLHEIDFAKGVLMLSVVVFHLGYFSLHYPKFANCHFALVQPCFLLISGYLFSLEKTLLEIKGVLRRIFIPYVVFETLYLLAIKVLGNYVGASNTFDGNVVDFFLQIVTSPIGTYWYLHTITLCILIFYTVNYIGIKGKSNIYISGILLFLVSNFIDGLKWENVMYFIIGISFRILDFPIVEKLKSYMCGLAFCAIIIVSDSITRYSIAGIGLTMTFLGFLFAITHKIPIVVKSIFIYAGRNSLSILLFSPFFTTFTKVYSPLFGFDSTRFLWMFVSLNLVSVLCLVSAKLMDVIKISKLLMGKNMYSPFSKVE